MQIIQKQLQQNMIKTRIQLPKYLEIINIETVKLGIGIMNGIGTEIEFEVILSPLFLPTSISIIKVMNFASYLVSQSPLPNENF